MHTHKHYMQINKKRKGLFVLLNSPVQHNKQYMLIHNSDQNAY